MSKFTINIKFSLEMNGDMPFLTCVCGNGFMINRLLFNNGCKYLFRCPYCKKIWHYETNKELKKVLIIEPKTNIGIAIKKENQQWILGDKI